MAHSIERQFVRCGVLFLLVTCVAALAFAQTVISVRPGLISYAEGQVKLAGAGPKPPDKDLHLGQGQHLLTAAGRVEILLTPVAILRAGGASDWEMVSADASDVRMKLHRGSGIVEVRARVKGARVSVEAGGASVRLENKGVYRFDLFPGSNAVLTVLKGKAQVSDGGGSLLVKSKRSVALGAGPLEAGKIASSTADALAAWHHERSALLAQSTRRARPRQVAGVPELTGSAFGRHGSGAIQCQNGTPRLLH